MREAPPPGDDASTLRMLAARTVRATRRARISLFVGLGGLALGLTVAVLPLIAGHATVESAAAVQLALLLLLYLLVTGGAAVLVAVTVLRRRVRKVSRGIDTAGTGAALLVLRVVPWFAEGRVGRPVLRRGGLVWAGRREGAVGLAELPGLRAIEIGGERGSSVRLRLPLGSAYADVVIASPGGGAAFASPEETLAFVKEARRAIVR